MSGGREAILGKVARRLGAGGAAARAATADARLAAKAQTAPIPSFARLDGAERIERFCAQAEGVHATVERLPTLEALPEALAAALRGRNLPLSVRMGDEPAFQNLDFGVVETSRGPGRVDEPATLSRATAAAAETGTCVLTSGPDNPVTLTFLGDLHLIVVYASEIEAGLEGVFAKLRALGLDPRTINMVTGPSRTADIEQTLELGAHGPVAVHIFVVEDR